MSDMPELRTIPDAVLDAFHPAPLTPAEAMRLCPEVTAAIESLSQLAWHPALKGLAMAERAQARLAPFTEGTD